MVFAHFNFFPSVHYVYYLLPSARFMHDDVIRSSAVNLHLTFDLGSAHHRCPYSYVCGRVCGRQ